MYYEVPIDSSQTHQPGGTLYPTTSGDQRMGTQQSPTEIRFYDRKDKYYEFTNFSNHSIRYNGKDYATAEHLFQSLKVGACDLLSIVKRLIS
jgi:predicted NAD-dependent protein-ADP-ribosyltransferase YbiA (DUF1768 family)